MVKKIGVPGLKSECYYINDLGTWKSHEISLDFVYLSSSLVFFVIFFAPNPNICLSLQLYMFVLTQVPLLWGEPRPCELCER